MKGRGGVLWQWLRWPKCIFRKNCRSGRTILGRQNDAISGRIEDRKPNLRAEPGGTMVGHRSWRCSRWISSVLCTEKETLNRETPGCSCVKGFGTRWMLVL